MNSMRALIACLSIFSASGQESCGPLQADSSLDGPGLSMLQRQMGARRPKPWEVNRYILANYHKAGVHLTTRIFFSVFSTFDHKPHDFGNWDGDCGLLTICFDLDAPVLQITDAYNLSMAEEQSQRDRPLLTVVTVRDPVMMAASAYCYHHAGQEVLTNDFMPIKELEKLGVQDGTQLAAESMLPIIQDLLSVAELKDTEQRRTKLISYEFLTKSSENFDRTINELLDFWFPEDLITASERQKAFEAALPADLHRFPEAATSHTNDRQCEAEAMEAMEKIEPKLLKTYQDFRKRLGY